jgi:hypothetical protein
MAQGIGSQIGGAVHSVEQLAQDSLHAIGHTVSEIAHGRHVDHPKSSTRQQKHGKPT